MKTFVHKADFAAWRTVARQCLKEDLAPGSVHFEDTDEAQQNLFGADDGDNTKATSAVHAETDGPLLTLPRRFIDDAQVVAVHNDTGRWDLLYRIIWRLSHGEAQLLSVATDADTRSFVQLQKAVQRDVHKCHAFVRFRAIADTTAPDGQQWVAWYKPDYRVLPLAAPHFAARFGQMAWSILTPDASVVHRDGQLEFGPGCPRTHSPPDDELEALWKTYYVNIFNPARLNRRAMLQEMPRRFWQNMPETQAIDGLVKDASKRTQAYLTQQPPQAPDRTPSMDLAALHEAARQCRICTWCTQATQVVVGEGAPTASVMLVGEQPGDQEDRLGRPFVGPAGRLLDRALQQAGIDRGTVYVTNAVKHFKWTPRGKRRLHQKPAAADVAACRPWLVDEIRLLQPNWIVCLGTTAMLAVLNKAPRLKDVRGQVLHHASGAQIRCTTHPSAILRTPPEAQEAAFEALVEDLRYVARQLTSAA